MVRIVQCGNSLRRVWPVDGSGNRGFPTVKNSVCYFPEFPIPKALICDLCLDGFSIAQLGVPKHLVAIVTCLAEIS